MATRRPRAIVLGSGAGGGLPQWNCGCRHCEMVRAGHPGISPRDQASLALTGDGVRWLVVNASPDIRAQLSRTLPLWPPPGTRDPPITDVLLTGGEIDQIAGLLTLREGHPFRLHAAEDVHAILASNPVFDALRPSLVDRVVIAPPVKFELAGLSAEVIALPGKEPLYLENAEGRSSGAEEATLAVLLRPAEGGRSLAYVPGCATTTEALDELLARADIIVLDGTVFHDDELSRAGMGEKTGRRMGHLPIAGPGGTLDYLAALAPRRRIYSHVNNTNPILVEGSPERLIVEAAGIEVAFDGMEIEL